MEDDQLHAGLVEYRSRRRSDPTTMPRCECKRPLNALGQWFRADGSKVQTYVCRFDQRKYKLVTKPEDDPDVQQPPTE